MNDPAHSPTPLDAASVRSIVVMGVSGSGKSHLTRRLADRLVYAFIESDDLHSPEDIAHMSSGVALTDEERWPWLHRVGEKILEFARAGEGSVTACSALRRSYRDVIRSYVPDAYFIELDGSPTVLRSRMLARRGSYMPASLLDSQLATLEPLGPDERGVRVDADRSPDDVLAAAKAALAM